MRAHNLLLITFVLALCYCINSASSASLRSNRRLCRNQPIGTIIPNPHSDDSYYICMGKTAIPRHCPDSFHFDTRSLLCLPKGNNNLADTTTCATPTPCPTTPAPCTPTPAPCTPKPDPCVTTQATTTKTTTTKTTTTKTTTSKTTTSKTTTSKTTTTKTTTAATSATTPCAPPPCPTTPCPPPPCPTTPCPPPPCPTTPCPPTPCPTTVAATTSPLNDRLPCLTNRKTDCVWENEGKIFADLKNVRVWHLVKNAKCIRRHCTPREYFDRQTGKCERV